MNSLKIGKRSDHMPLKSMRLKGVIPGIIYGQSIANTPITALRRDLNRATERSGEVYIVKVENKTVYTRIERIQRDPVTREMLHFSLVQLPTGQYSEVLVPIVLKGEPKGKKNGGVLVHIKEEVPIKGRPNSIPDQIEVDVSDLDVGDKVQIESLQLPKTVELGEGEIDIIAFCSPPAKPYETTSENNGNDLETAAS